MQRREQRQRQDLAWQTAQRPPSKLCFDVLEGVVATKSTPDSVDLKLSNYSTTAAMNGSIASANNATLATLTANYGLKRWWTSTPWT